MKKIFTLLLCIVLVLSFAACGNGPEPVAEAEAEEVDVHTATKNLLNTLPCGRADLRYHLGEEGYTEKEVTEAMIFIDWKEQALNKAKWMLEISPYSRERLLFFLINLYEFTTEEATYAVDNCGADWKEQALREVEGLAEKAGASYEDLYSSSDAIIQYLIQEGEYTVEEACYAAIEATVQAAISE